MWLTLLVDKKKVFAVFDNRINQEEKFHLEKIEKLVYSHLTTIKYLKYLESPIAWSECIHYCCVHCAYLCKSS